MITKQVWKIGDCLELLWELPDASVDLIFTDPPFNISKNYGLYKDHREDYQGWCKEWITEGFRVLRSTGSFYLMTLTRHLEWILPTMAEHGTFINLISWRNVSACHSKNQFWNEYQPIAVYGKTDNYKFNTYAETEETGWRRWGGYSTEYKGQLKDRWEDITFIYAGSIQHPEAVLEPNTKKKAHPAQMPIGLPKRAILFSTDEGDTVLDPFLGSGSTLRACRETNRNGIGFEINPDYEWIIKQHALIDTPSLETWIDKEVVA